MCLQDQIATRSQVAADLACCIRSCKSQTRGFTEGVLFQKLSGRTILAVALKTADGAPRSHPETATEPPPLPTITMVDFNTPRATRGERDERALTGKRRSTFDVRPVNKNWGGERLEEKKERNDERNVVKSERNSKTQDQKRPSN